MKRWFDKIYLGLIIFLMIIAIYGAVTRTLSYDKVLLILILCNVSYLNQGEDKSMMADWAWTSVTKALPPDNLLVLITVEIGNKRGTAFGFMRDGEWKSEVLIDRPNAKVVAWQTLPEPYRGVAHKPYAINRHGGVGVMTNAEWMIKNGYKFTDLLITYFMDGVYKISVCGKPITEYKATNEITYLEVVLKWLDMEHDEKILNDAEKKYLSAVIKPFRDRVEFICKSNSLERYGFQCIDIRFTDESIDMELPIFESGTMYKGMEFGKEYTLEELGI